MLFSGAFDGTSATDRLNNALNALTEGTIIFVEGTTYSTDTTIPKRRRLVRSGVWPLDSSTVDAATWTINEGVLIDGISLTDTAEFVFSGANSKYINSHNAGSATISVNSDFLIMTGVKNGNVTFASGTSSGVVDSCVSVSVTDNGSNTVGDIS